LAASWISLGSQRRNLRGADSNCVKYLITSLTPPSREWTEQARVVLLRKISRTLWGKFNVFWLIQQRQWNRKSQRDVFKTCCYVFWRECGRKTAILRVSDSTLLNYVVFFKLCCPVITSFYVLRPLKDRHILYLRANFCPCKLKRLWASCSNWNWIWLGKARWWSRNWRTAMTLKLMHCTGSSMTAISSL
jgi:hypothetical protein